MKYILLTTLMLFTTLCLHAQELEWATKLGGVSFDHGYAVQVDEDGNVYTTGSFEGLADFDPGPGFEVHPSNGDADVFVCKQDSAGNRVWSIHFGGATEDYGEAIGIDEAGNIYITGYFNGTSDFDPGPGSAMLTAAGNYDVFVAKYDANGTFIWAKRLGGTDADQVRAMTLDTAGHPVLVGHFNGTADFDPGAATYNLTSEGGNDIFIAKLNSDGLFIWAKQTGSTGNDMARGVAIDADNNVMTTGRFAGTVDFNPGVGVSNRSSNGLEDVFVFKLDEAGDFMWAVSFGADQLDEGTAIHADNVGRIYVAGFFEGTVDFDPGPASENLTGSGEEDVFISVLQADGALVFARQMGGPGLEKPHAITTDTAGNIYTAGYFTGQADFDPGTTDSVLISVGQLDVFISKLSAVGQFIWVAQFGGPEDDRSLDMTVGDSARVYVSGYFAGTTDFDPGPGEFNLTAEGNTDIFVSVLDQCYPVYSEINPTACDSYTSPDGLEVWTQSGTYLDTVISSGGCLNIITVQLTILSSTDSVLTETACDSYTSPDGLETWTVSGQYTDTLVNSAGCDSIIMVQLTILNSTSSEFNAQACASYVSPDGLEVWSSTGIYTDTLVNAAGCDSVITVHLTINNSYAEIPTEACDSYTSPDGLETWTSSGTYTDTLVNAAGCDSIITVLLTIHPSTSSELTIEACDSYPSPDGLELWTQSGVYYDTIPNVTGCDSTITIALTIHTNTFYLWEVTSCDSLISPSGQHVWTSSGTYQDIIPNAAGCDSFISVNLTIILSSTAEITATACDSYTSPGGTQTWTASGTYQDVIPNAAGCDSLVIINLTIFTSPSSTLFAEACDMYTSPTGMQTWTESGIYQEFIPVSGQCDSIVTVNLTVYYSATAEVEQSACDSIRSPDGTEMWTESGVYIDTIATSTGCDSFVTVQLTILHSSASELDVTACDSFTLPGGTQTWTESGTYQDIIPNGAGCDSLVTIHLTIQPTPASEITVEACDRYTLPGGTQTWTASGTYQEAFPVGGPCDSIVTVNLTIFNSSASTLTATGCDSFLSPSQKYQWTESGIYADTISNAAGCDSILTVDLTIININTGVVQDEVVLTAEMAGVSYQWIDCDNGNQPIEGETAQQFTATASGNYAVIVSSEGCADTSSCYSVTVVSTRDVINLTDLNLYPNPAHEHFVIRPGRRLGDGKITISDLQGQEWYAVPYQGEESLLVSLKAPSGLYIVTLTGAEYRIVGKVMME